MNKLGLNNDISVGDRKFHVQTDYSDLKKVIKTCVFNEGQVIDSKEVSTEDGLSLEEIKNRMNEIHQELITEMEVLYYIYEKVKTVKHAHSANKLGLLFLKKNLLKEAIEQFNLALEIDPNLTEVYVNLGRALIIADSCVEAIEVLEKGSNQAPNFADIQNYLGIAYLYQEKFENAIKYFQQAIKLNPNYIGAFYHLGMAQLAHSLICNNGHDQSHNDIQNKALEHLHLASERMVERQIPNFEKVMNLVTQKSYKEAVDEFLLTKPREALTHVLNIENEFYLKFMYGGKGKDDTFIAEYVQKLRELVDEHPDYADIRNNLGIA
ncbi:MAG: tetratricopeptide repeat protein, partial [bacterium]